MEIENIFVDLPALATELLVLRKVMVIKEENQDLKLYSMFKEGFTPRCIR
ncbi:hypothetical protein [Neobacillus sp. NPDC093127]